MSLTLREYQVRRQDELRELIRSGVRRILLQGSTGSGKTVEAADLISKCVQKGKRCWFVNHRREIIRQSVQKLSQFELPISVAAAGFPCDANAPVQVCSVQSLGRRQFGLPRPDLIVWDEVHHVASNSWSAVFAANPQAVHIGLSATPARLDGVGLGNWFDHMLLGPTTAQLIADGWLSPYRLFAPSRPDLSHVQTLAGDYNQKQLAVEMERSGIAGDTVAHYLKHVSGKRAIVFLWSVESSIDMAARFNRAGVPAAHIDGGTDERTRDRAIQMFRDGQILVLTNVDIVAEGFDAPAASAGFFCRPTQSLVLWRQQCGRVLRPEPGKTAYLFDQASNSRRLGLPDEDYEWSLDSKKTRRKKAEDDEDAVRVCPQCTEAHGMHVRVCTCGYVLVQAREMDVDETAELAEVDPHELKRQRWQRLREQGQAKDLESLIAYGQSKGYKNPHAWARVMLRARQEKAAKYAAKRAEQRPPDPPITEEVEEQWLF